ncbi:hypothetical protein Ahp2_79 [Aeromonas phage Ahp2]|nr:hypothetical protein Ahp2_79 [Aeromonas phage Ahp2]
MPDLIHILLAVALILSLVVIVISLKLAGLADRLFLTEQRLTGHINKMGDALNGHHRRQDLTSEAITDLNERLRRIEDLAMAAAATIPAQTMDAHQAHTAELLEHLNALQKEFEQDGAHFSYQLVYPRK